MLGRQKAQGGWNAEGKPQGKGDTDKGRAREARSEVGRRNRREGRREAEGRRQRWGRWREMT